MTAATLPPLDVARALTDVAYYDQRIDKAPENTHRQVEAAVTAYAATHPITPQEPAPRPLDYAEKRILDFANRRFHTPGEREQAIRDEFGYSATRYYQRLGALIDQPRALAYAPLTVNRLRRVREIKRHARSARRLTTRSAA